MSRVSNDDDATRPRVALYVGMSGAGKTYALEADACERVDAGRRALVIDTAREWNAAPESCDAVPAASVREAREKLDAGARLVVYARPRDRTIGPSKNVGVVEHAAFAALDYGEAGRGIDLVVTEAHFHFPESAPLGEQSKQLVTMFRHYDAGLACDTQRFAAIRKQVLAQATHMRLFAMVASRDLDVVDDLGGPALVAAIGACAAKYAQGEPGWHVAIDPRRPPVKPEIVRL